MSLEPRLVLDANILIRATLGRRVRTILANHVTTSSFFAPEVAYADARRHLPTILTKHSRADEIDERLTFLDQLQATVHPVPEDAYAEHQAAALLRIAVRDPDDWPMVALAITLECPIWTEDDDFFGTGVATWTTDRVEIFLAP